MIKEKFRKALVALGVATTAIVGIILFSSGERDFLTIQERDELIKQYNFQLQVIRNDCESDIRCEVINGQKYAIFGRIASKKEVPQKINEWIADGNDPKYKRP